MSLYRRKYWVTKRDGSREQRTASTFTIEFKRPDGRLFRVNSKLRNRKAAQILENNLRKEMEMGSVGAIDPFREQKAKPIAEQFDAFVGELQTQKRDDMYRYISRKRLERVAAEAGWATLGDVTLTGFTDWRTSAAKTKHRGRLPTPKTLNQYLDTWRQFLDFCVDTERLKENPLARVKKIRVIDNPDFRRAGTREELAKFMAACSLEERRYYQFALLTTLRRATIGDLRVSDVRDMDGGAAAAHLLIRGESFKGRRTLRHPIHPDLFPLLQELVAGKAPGERLFPHPPTIDDMRARLAEAGVPFADERGNRRLDLHAFRKTMTAWMERAGVSLRDAQRLLGHRQISTTEKSYREVGQVEDHGLGKVAGVSIPVGVKP